ncbi:Putative protein C4orf22 [Chelonia mydas]|uniref:Cilia- and flagella-associated protein 299 n=1 Tax=Chelonia mydas TaxID=8469 RepID=M7BQG4_CHEMY|nr:Putative protein C4orf22 [Chelonia mydas]
MHLYSEAEQARGLKNKCLAADYLSAAPHQRCLWHLTLHQRVLTKKRDRPSKDWVLKARSLIQKSARSKDSMTDSEERRSIEHSSSKKKGSSTVGPVPDLSTLTSEVSLQSHQGQEFIPVPTTLEAYADARELLNLSVSVCPMVQEGFQLVPMSAVPTLPHHEYMVLLPPMLLVPQKLVQLRGNNIPSTTIPGLWLPISGSNQQSIIFIRDRNSRGQEMSAYIDYAHRLKVDEFEIYFNGKKKLFPRRTDLSSHWPRFPAKGAAGAALGVEAEYGPPGCPYT